MEFPDDLLAATKIAVEDARAQWTTYNRLNKWFDDVKKDILALDLLSTKTSLMRRTEHWCQRFRSQSSQRENLLTWMRLTMTLVSLATRVVLALCLITTQCHREEQQKEPNQQGMCQEHTQQMQQDKLCHRFTFMILAQNQMTTFVSRLIGLSVFSLWRRAGMVAQLMWTTQICFKSRCSLPLTLKRGYIWAHNHLL